MSLIMRCFVGSCWRHGNDLRWCLLLPFRLFQHLTLSVWNPKQSVCNPHYFFLLFTGTAPRFGGSETIVSLERPSHSPLLPLSFRLSCHLPLGLLLQSCKLSIPALERKEATPYRNLWRPKVSSPKLLPALTKAYVKIDGFGSLPASVVGLGWDTGTQICTTFLDSQVFRLCSGRLDIESGRHFIEHMRQFGVS